MAPALVLLAGLSAHSHAMSTAPSPPPPGFVLLAVQGLTPRWAARVSAQAPGAPHPPGRDVVPDGEWQCACCGPFEKDSAERELYVGVLRPRKGASTEGNLAYELRRRCLSQVGPSGCPHLDRLIRLDDEGRGALLDDEQRCLEEAKAICGELDQSEYVGCFASGLKSALGGPLDGAMAVRLVRAWLKIECRNAVLVEYSSVLTGLVRSNTPPLMLGAGHSAKAAGMCECCAIRTPRVGG